MFWLFLAFSVSLADEDVMEDKTLNFNQPLLSVRRRTPTSSSEPLDERRTNVSRPVVPRLPPHRSELTSGPIRIPGAVPFMWEQTPGQPKKEPKPIAQNYDGPPIAPKLPPGRYPKHNQKDCDKRVNQAINVPPSIAVDTKQISYVPCTGDNKQETLDESVKNVENSKETTEDKESSDSGDSDAFVDALDTLSRTESSFLNCSVSGTHGLDDLDLDSSGILVTDPQAQKLMLDRFLPAAKAMASDTIHHTPKRQPVIQEPPKKLNKGVNQFKPTLRYGPSFAKRYSEYCDVEEKEDSEDDDDHQENMPGVCGLLPRFCLKGSIGRLNPVPGMSVRTRVPISPYRARSRSSSAGSYSETVNESRSNRREVKSIRRVRTAELVEGKAQSRNGYRQFETHATSTYHNATWSLLETKQLAAEPEEKMNDDNNDSGVYGNGYKTFREVLADRDTPKDLSFGILVVEKTLYVDKVQKLESPKLMSPSRDAHNTEEFLPTSKENHESTTITMAHIPTTDLNADDFKKFESADECDDSNMLPSFGKPNGAHGTEVPNAPTTTETTVPVNERVDTSDKQLPSYDEILAPPPLPKSPSDSWLLRTLPCVSKNSPLHSHFGAAKDPQNYGSNAPANNVKWETIVKTAKFQHRHMHHSVGLLTTIPEA